MVRTVQPLGYEAVDKTDRGFCVGGRPSATRLDLMNAPTAPDGAAQSEQAQHRQNIGDVEQRRLL